MKILALFFCAVLAITSPVFAQKKKDDSKKKDTPKVVKKGEEEKSVIDFKIKPKVGEMRDLEFPQYSQATLKNGLKVIVIEDHKQPTISFRLQVRAGESLDGDKNGISYLMTNLLTKGTAKRNALDIAGQMDSVGASITTNTGGEMMTVSAEGLKKSTPLLLSIFADVVQNPTFPKEELDKLMPQVMASIQQEKSNPSQLAAALSRMVIYGKDHPSAMRRTEESVTKISVEDIRAFHEKYVRPNNLASLAIVGDVSLKEILPQLEMAFKRWSPNTSLNVPPLPPTKPMPKGVYFIHRPGSVQSTVLMCAPVPARKDDDYEKMYLATALLGNGFGGRLFKSLRETYSYTYTPFAFMTQGKYFNRFAAGADVRNAVTDSAIMVMQKEFARVVSEAATDEEFDLIKQVEVGNYLMTFEKSDFIASILQNADYLELSPEYMKGYAKRLSTGTPYDAQRAAMKYIRPDKCYLVVVGSPDVLPMLEKYGKVYNYDLDLKPLGENFGLEKVNMSANEVLAKYTDAIGGTQKIQAIQSLIRKAKVTLEAGGQKFTGSSVQKQKAPAKMYSLLDLPVTKQERWIADGKVMNRELNNPPGPLPADEAVFANDEANLFYVTKLPQLGYTCEVAGKKKGQIVMTIKKNKKEQQLYFDEKTFLLMRVERNEETPQGPLMITERYSDYTEVNGVKVPKIEKLELPGGVSITGENSFEVNTPIDDKDFVAPQE